MQDALDEGPKVTHDEPILSPTVAFALSASAEVSAWIGAHHPDQVLNSLRHRLAGPLFGICMEHREAILLLVEHDHRSAAFALQRSVYEALMRGLWAVLCLKDKHVEQIVETHEMPSLDTMIKSLDALEPSGVHSFGASKLKVWKMMSHFAHGGVQQLARWTGPDGIGPRHPNDEVIALLKRVDTWGLLACRQVIEMAGLPTGAAEDKITAQLAAL